MGINLICAMDKNRGIGINNQLLAYLPNDLKYFKSLTKDSIVVMGRKTYESIIDKLGKPLPNRISLVLSKDVGYDVNYSDTYVYNSIHDILDDHKQHCEGDLWVIGGQQIYELFLPYVDKLFLTIIDYEFKADTYFPVISDDWKCTSKTTSKWNEDNQYDHHFLVYEKK